MLLYIILKVSDVICVSESNRDTGARTLINHTRTPTHSSVAAEADKKLGRTIRAQIPKGALRKQIDDRSVISKIKARYM